EPKQIDNARAGITAHQATDLWRMPTLHRHLGPPLALAAVGLVLICASGDARAGVTASESETVNPDHAAQPNEPPLRLGVLAGVGFPRPFAVEALASIASVADVGVEYGFLPGLDVSSVHTDLWSVAGDLRVRPFRGAFFLGVLVGRQHIGATTTVTASGLGSATEQLGLDSWFVNPRIGFLWTTHYGLALGLDAGLQV